MSGGFDPAVAEWAAFAGSPRYNLAEKCLKLAQLLEYPDLDMEQCIGFVRTTGLSLGKSVGDAADPARLAAALGGHLYGDLGFACDDAERPNPRYCLFNEVIACRRGTPVTLAVLYAEVAKFVGLDLAIVGHGGRVLARHAGGMVLDPSRGGAVLGPGDPAVRGDPAPPAEIGEGRLLAALARSIRDSYVRSLEYERASLCADMILAILPGSAPDVRDKGIIESRMLHRGEALVYLNRYLEMRPDAEDVDHVLGMIGEIGSSR